MSGLFQELKRRNVFRVAIAYLAVAWLILQVADIVFENIGAPAWVMQAVMFTIAIVDRTQSITSQTGQKLNRTIIVVLLAAVGFLLADKFMLGGGTSPEAGSDPSVAVLPFVAMSSGADDEFFADGLTEEILNSLTRVPDLLVTARTSAFYFKGQDIPIPKIADELGVEHIVEGSIRRDGDRLRVTAQLIRAADGFHLWSENYDRSTEDTFGVQTDVAEKIAAALGVILDEETRENMRAAGFRNPEAYTALQKGRALYDEAHNHWSILPLLEEANVWLNRVIELEPSASRAYLYRVDYHTHRLADDYDNMSAEEREETARQFRADLDSAVETASNEMMRAAARYDRMLLTGDWRQLHQALDTITQSPGCPEPSWLNTLTIENGKAADVLSLAERMIVCDPKGPFGWWYAVQANLWLGDFDRAIELAEQGLLKTEHTLLRNGLFQAYIATGQFNDAEYVLTQIDARSPEELAEWKVTLAAARGDREQALIQKDLLLSYYDDRPAIAIYFIPRFGDRELANQTAAELDVSPYGYLSLMSVAALCFCGAPWDLEVTPNFARRIESASFEWPPASPINWPLKDW
jgi:TolB-like protein